MSTLQRAGVVPYWHQSMYRAMSGTDQSGEAKSLAWFYGRDPWFSSTITVAAEVMASWPARLHRRRRTGELRLVDERHPANEILNRRPNRNVGPTAQTANQVQCEAFCWFAMLGTFYIRKSPREMPRPVELHVLNPYHLTPRLKGGEVGGYRYLRPGFKPEDLELDELIIGRRFNPNSDTVGQGYGQPMLDTLEGRRLAAKWTRNLMENDGASSDLYAHSKEPKTQEALERAAREFQDRYGGADSKNAGQIMFMGDFDLKDIGRSPRDMQWQEFVKQSLLDIAAGGRVDARLLGNDSSSTYNNLLEARKGLVDFNVEPLARMFWDIINYQFVRPTYGDDLEFVLDLSREPVAMERAGAMIDRLFALAAPGAGKAQGLSMGEFRDALAELAPTVAHVLQSNEEADYVRTVPMGAVPNTYNLERSTPAAPPEPAGVSGDGEPDEAEEDNAEDRGSSARGFGRLFGLRRSSKPRIVRAEQGFIEGVLYWGEEFRAKAREIAETYHRALFEARLDEVASELGIELADAFVDTDPRVVKWLRQYPTTFADQWADTTLSMLRSELEIAVSEGETVTDALERVDRVFGGRKNNALTVAITQTTPAYNSSAVSVYAKAKEEGILATKDWLPNTERHADVAGGVDVDGFFDVHGYPARYPGDPMLPIGEAAGCACSVAPGPVSDEERKADPAELRNRTPDSILAWAGRYEPSLRELLQQAQDDTRAALQALEAEETEERGTDDGRGHDDLHARNGDGVGEPVLVDRA